MNKQLIKLTDELLNEWLNGENPDKSKRAWKKLFRDVEK